MPGDSYTVVGDHVFTAQWKKAETPPPGKDPKTGDDSMLGMWFALLLFSTFGFVSVLLFLVTGFGKSTKRHGGRHRMMR